MSGVDFIATLSFVLLRCDHILKFWYKTDMDKNADKLAAESGNITEMVQLLVKWN